MVDAQLCANAANSFSTNKPEATHWAERYWNEAVTLADYLEQKPEDREVDNREGYKDVLVPDDISIENIRVA